MPGSYSQTAVFASLPRTERGRPFVLGGDPKGKNFLYCFEKSVIIRDIENPAISDVYTQHSTKTTVAKYAPSGYYIASADESGKVRIWDTTQKEHILKYEYQPISGAIKDLCWSPDSKRIAVGGAGRGKFTHCFLWDSGSSVGELIGHSKEVNTIDYRPARPFRIISGGDDNATVFSEGPPFKFKLTNNEHTNFVSCVRYSPDGERYVTVGSSCRGFIYDGKTGELIGELGGGGNKAHDGGIYGCSWSPDGTQLITCSADKTVKLWDIAQNSLVTEFKMGTTLEDHQLSCLWQGDYLLSVSLGGYINYLDRSNPARPCRIVKGHRSPISSMAVTEDKATIYTGDNSGRITHWDVASGDHDVIEGQGHKNMVSSMGIEGGSLVTCSMDDTVRYTPVPGNEYGAEVIQMDSQPQSVGLGTGGLAVSACLSEVVVMRNGRKVFSLPVDYTPSAAAVHPSQTQVVVGSRIDNNLRVYNLAGDTLVDCRTVKLSGAVSALSFTADGRYLACAQKSKHITPLDTTNDYQVVPRTGGWMHNANVTCVSWNPSGTHLVSGSLDTNLTVWSLEKPSDITTLRAAHPLSVITGLAWLSDNKFVSVGSDNAIRHWDISD